eukprot:CAMPEP_0172160404 /NCGR_PEP_ID=MMETSP1050-20130122/5539_1 /TAXON_ID=233186 /ORGANISM="Cryptomonas curvata, Strain CCAP979/52" /LENGTH=180 /DNA_ID=CAMNT_0012830163 /DNA_START=170 /DNA_END=708 /DNA_ORIENTATION=+
MSFLFGSKPQNPKDVVRQEQRDLRKSERGLEREQRGMQQQEQKLIADIKKASKDGNMTVANALAKELIRVRQTATRTAMAKSQLSSVSSRLSSVSAQGSLSTALAGASKAVKMVNGQLDVAGMRRVMQDYERENDVMEAKQETMDDALEDIFGDERLDGEADELTAQVLQEIGLDFRAKA